jgi:hypothetical protein
MRASAKRTVPVTASNLRAYKVLSTRRVPTLAKAFQPFVGQDAHKQPCRVYLLRGKEIRRPRSCPMWLRDGQTEAFV